MNIFTALFLTLLIEGAVAAVWFRSWRVLGPVLLVSLVTNPLLNLIVQAFGLRLMEMGLWVPAQLFLECLVVISEALMLRAMLGWKHKKAFFVSFVLNAASYLTGVVINAII